MAKSQLFVCRGSHPAPNLNDVIGLIGGDRKAERGGINQAETIAPIRGIYFHSTHAFDLKRRLKPVNKGWHILNPDLRDCAIATSCRRFHQSSGRFQVNDCFRFLHGQNTGLKQDSTHTDCV